MSTAARLIIAYCLYTEVRAGTFLIGYLAVVWAALNIYLCLRQPVSQYIATVDVNLCLST